MWALIAFIGLGILTAALIEINERRKAKKSKGEGREANENCPPQKAGSEDCSACELLSVCEKQKPAAS